MSKIEKKIKLFIGSATILSILLGVYYLYVLNMSDKISAYYWMMNIKIVTYVVISFTLSLLILLFFKSEIFNKWLSGFVSWYVPLYIILIMTGTTGSSYAWFSRADIATFLGIVLVVVTLVFALVQKFVYKK